MKLIINILLIFLIAISAYSQTFINSGCFITINNKTFIRLDNLSFYNISSGKLLIKDSSEVYAKGVVYNNNGSLELFGKSILTSDSNFVNQDTLLIKQNSTLIIRKNMVNSKYINNHSIIEIGE